MKRLWGILGALAVVGALSLTAVQEANAGNTFVHLAFKNVPFRTKLAVEQQGYLDSMVTHRVGTQICPLDTTAAISTLGWSIPSNQALSDTSGFFCKFIVFDPTGTACESGADSLYIAVQVSADGVTWATPKTFVGGTTANIVSRLSQVNVTGQFYGALSLNGAALAQGAPIWQIPYKIRAVNIWDELSTANINSWPYLRWIVGFPDAKGYGVSARVVFLSSSDATGE